MGDFYRFGWKPYVPMAARRRQAERALRELRRQGRVVSPVAILGRRVIALTFWGKAWCTNLEGYSDYSNRLPRGRTYVRNGSVLDLQVAAGEVRALVSGSSLYQVTVKVAAVPPARWASICSDCAGAIDSLVELLQGRLSRAVMERICHQKAGLFPAPTEIRFSCDCPDWAMMCKHVAAVLYGIGARLDEQPALLFKLRKVDERDLIARAGARLPLSKSKPAARRILRSDRLSEIFGLELGKDGHDSAVSGPRKATKPAPAKRAGKRAAKPAAPGI